MTRNSAFSETKAINENTMEAIINGQKNNPMKVLLKFFHTLNTLQNRPVNARRIFYLLVIPFPRTVFLSKLTKTTSFSEELASELLKVTE